MFAPRRKSKKSVASLFFFFFFLLLTLCRRHVTHAKGTTTERRSRARVRLHLLRRAVPFGRAEGMSASLCAMQWSASGDMNAACAWSLSSSPVLSEWEETASCAFSDLHPPPFDLQTDMEQKEQLPDRETEEAVSSIVSHAARKSLLAKEEEERVVDDEDEQSAAEQEACARSQELLSHQHHLQQQQQQQQAHQELSSAAASAYHSAVAAAAAANSTASGQSASPTSSYQMLAPMSVSNYKDTLAPSNAEPHPVSTAANDPFAPYIQHQTTSLPAHALPASHPVQASTPHAAYGPEPGFQEVHLASDQESHVNPSVATVAMNTALGYTTHAGTNAATAVPVCESGINLEYAPMVNDYNPYTAAAAAAYYQRNSLPLQYASYGSSQAQSAMTSWPAGSIDAYGQHAAFGGGGGSAWTQLQAANPSVLASERYIVPTGNAQVPWDSMERGNYPTLPSISQEFGFGGELSKDRWGGVWGRLSLVRQVLVGLIGRRPPFLPSRLFRLISDYAKTVLRLLAKTRACPNKGDRLGHC